MPVENRRSTVFGISGPGPNGYTPPFAAAAMGKLHRVAGRATALLADNTNSRYLLCQLPSTCILLQESAIRTDLWAFAQAVIGTIGFQTGLLNVARATGGATGNLPVTIFGARWNQPLWQALGMAAPPTNPVIDLIAFAIADATVLGTLDFDLRYVNHIN